jgi:2-polyprenyl-6-methoxyphenol hydroxylase-like FAD-dependent oxidoreductase
MGFNTFCGDKRTYAIILVVPGADCDLRVLRRESAWMAACAAIRPLDILTSPEHGRPITDVMPMGGLMNVNRTGDAGMAGLVAVGDALCHTDPVFAYGLSFALAHAQALARATVDAPDADAVISSYRAAVVPEAEERYRLACETDDARGRRWRGEPLDVGSRDGCFPLFSFTTALAAAQYDDLVLRSPIGRIGLLERTAVFGDDTELHTRIERIFEELMTSSPPSPGPSREALLGLLG